MADHDPWAAALSELTPPEPKVTSSWRDTARPDQIAPPGWRRTWYVRGGRGGGKTWTGSNNFAELIVSNDPGEWAVIAPTYGDVRDTCIESSESGLIKALGGRSGPNGMLLDPGPYIASWSRSLGELRLNNGSVVYCDGADDGALRIQGKNLRGAWCDEVGLWKRWKTAWDESLRYAVRIDPALIIATGTPKRNMPAKELVKRLLGDERVVKTLLRTVDNKANLHPEALADLMEMAGTALGRQELEGELLDEVEGALWTPSMIDAYRIRDLAGETPLEIAEELDLAKILVAIDPSGGLTDNHDEQGIVVAGKGRDGDGYVLEDVSCRLSPEGWAARAIDAYRRWSADEIIVETNYGGDMALATIRAADSSVPVRKITASRGKRQRAEPISLRYEQGRVHHVGMFPDLEDQMCQWVPESGDSPDRMDALVWALTPLLAVGQGEAFMSVWKAKASGDDPGERPHLSVVA